MTSLSPSIQSVLELFKGPLGSVRFADIDAAGLATSAAEVEAPASEVELQEAKLTELRQGLAQRQEALLVLTQQALAYARVYAENDEPLLEELNRINLPRPTKPRKAPTPKPRETSRAEATSAESVGRESPGRESSAGESGALEAAVEHEFHGAPTSPEPTGASAETVAPAAQRNSRKGRAAAAQRAAG